MSSRLEISAVLFEEKKVVKLDYVEYSPHRDKNNINGRFRIYGTSLEEKLDNRNLYIKIKDKYNRNLYIKIKDKYTLDFVLGIDVFVYTHKLIVDTDAEVECYFEFEFSEREGGIE
jgi:hypothetical protein